MLVAPTIDIADTSQPNNEPLSSLLPASYRTKWDDLAAGAQHVAACIEKELDLQRLNKFSGWLWVAGRPMPPRPLHHQLLLSREIFVTEQIDVHLVWTTGRIFLKPLPRFLLDKRFWAQHLSCMQGCVCSGKVDLPNAHECERRRLRKCALGFLFSYAALITHESDFYIARAKHLLPPEVKWLHWRTFVEQLDTEHIYPKINVRFLYGELRMSRLNLLLILHRSSIRGYMSRWQQYSSFFGDNLAVLVSGTVYIAIVLTAMQVGLATKVLAENDAFQSASYGFTVFAIVGPLTSAGFIVFIFCCIFINNWLVAVAYKRRRFRHLARPLEI